MDTFNQLAGIMPSTPQPKATMRSVLMGRARATVLFMLALSVIAASCKTKDAKTNAPESCELSKDPSWPIKVFVQPTQDANAGPLGQAMDTQLQILQVSDLQKLEGLELTQLWEQKQELLGSDLIASTEHTVFAGETQTLELKLESDSTHVVVLALLRSALGQQFWSATSLPLNYATGVCQEVASTLPAPCYFVLVEKNQVQSGFAPPPSFDQSQVFSRCPTLSLLHHETFSPSQSTT